MADESPLAQRAVLPVEESPIPAPLGRTLLFVSLALGLSVALCWSLRESGLGSETGTLSGRPTPLVSDWTGRIEHFWVNPGDRVQAGDPIAVLTDEQLLLQIDRQKRELDEIKLALLRAEETLDQQLEVQLTALDGEIVALRTEAGVFSAAPSAPLSQLETLEAKRLDAVHQAREHLGIDRLREELLRAETKLQFLESQPKQITLPAPATGTIKRLLRKRGERIVPGTPLLELANQSQPYLVVEMPEPLAKRFALGDKIPLSFPGQSRTLGRVSHMERLDPKADSPQDSSDTPKLEASVRVEIEPIDQSWPELPLKSSVKVRTSDSGAMSRRIN